MDSHAARLFYAGFMEVRVFDDAKELGRSAARHAATRLEAAIGDHGDARLVVATGASQFTFYGAFVKEEVDWSKVEVMHLDEYAGIAADHPASFRRYLHERFVDVVGPRTFHEIKGDAEDLEAECERYSAVLSERPIDLCVCGIGENGHLAFNDPPVADFADPKLVKLVDLDDDCRRQQLGEGWFASLGEVPTHAISQTIPAVVSARAVIVVVPEKRKAEAVMKTVTGPVETSCPASILRRQPQATLYLDSDSASLLGIDD